MEEIDSYNEQPVNPHYVLVQAICNVISSLVMGSRRNYCGKDFKKHMKDLDDGFEVTFFSHLTP